MENKNDIPLVEMKRSRGRPRKSISPEPKPEPKLDVKPETLKEMTLSPLGQHEMSIGNYGIKISVPDGITPLEFAEQIQNAKSFDLKIPMNETAERKKTIKQEYDAIKAENNKLISIIADLTVYLNKIDKNI